MPKEKNNLKRREISQEEIGLPPASMDPMKTIEMEGAMLRGMVRSDSKRPLWIRLFSIFIGVFILSGALFYIILGGVIVLSEHQPLFSILRFFIVIPYALVGIIIIYKNIRVRKK